MFGYSGFAGGNVTVTNYMSNIRRFSHQIQNGRIVVTENHNGETLKHVMTAKNGVIATQSTRKNGKLVFFVEYGAVEKEGKKILRFRKGTNRGLDGMSTWRDCELAVDADRTKLVGTCKTFYRRGRLIWQKFYHQDTRRMAYHFKPAQKEHIVKRADGSVFARINGVIDVRAWREGAPVFSQPTGGVRFFTTNPRDDHWGNDLFRDGSGSCEAYDRDGKVWLRWKIENHQRVGEWIIDGNEHLFIDGLQVPKELYEAPPEKIDPVEVMEIEDTDVRSIFINRIGMDRIMKTFDADVLHEERDMMLFRMKFPEKTRQPFNILKVICTTTRQPYYLRVPTNIPECEQARQWTFGIDPGEKQIQFDIET